MINIEKIAVGRQHTLFLEDNGNVWCSGENTYNLLGLGSQCSDEFVYQPQQIPYFSKAW